LVGAQPVGRDLLRRVIRLDPIIDETIGESTRIRYHSPILQSAADGLLAALAGWHAVANHLVKAPSRERRPETAAIIESIPPELRTAGLTGAPARWMGDPTALRRLCELAVRQLLALPAGTRSVRLLADKTAGAFLGIAQALNGLSLLVADPAPPTSQL